MAKQKREKVNRDFSYQDIIDRLGEDEDVSFERVGDTIIIRREEPSARRVREGAAEPERYVEEKPHFERAAGLSGAEEKLFLVKKEIEKRKFRGVSRKDYEELNEAFSRLERRLESLDKELRSLRVELGYLRGVMLDKLRETREEPVMEKVEQPKVEAVAVGKEEKQLQLIQDDIPEMKFGGRKRAPLAWVSSQARFPIYITRYSLARVRRGMFIRSSRKDSSSL